mgnify:CR=1 FL=1
MLTLKRSNRLRETPAALGAAIWTSGVWFAVSVTVGLSPAGAAFSAKFYVLASSYLLFSSNDSVCSFMGLYFCFNKDNIFA